MITLSQDSSLGERLWDKILADRDFCAIYDRNSRVVYEAFVRALPTILADLLGQQLTITTLLQMRIALLEYRMQPVFIDRLTEAMFDNTSTVAAEFVENATRSIASYRIFLPQIPYLLGMGDRTDDELLRDPKIGNLSPAALRAYRSNPHFTIQDLLELEPWATIKQ